MIACAVRSAVAPGPSLCSTDDDIRGVGKTRGEGADPRGDALSFNLDRASLLESQGQKDTA